MVVSVKEFMTKKVITIQTSKTILQAAKTLEKQHVGSLVVVKGRKAVGIITDRDIVVRAVVKGVNLKKVKIEKIISKPLIKIGPNDPMVNAVKLMEENSIRRVPVVKGDRIVGIVTSSDVGRASKILAPYLLPRIPEIYLIPQQKREYKSVD